MQVIFESAGYSSAASAQCDWNGSVGQAYQSQWSLHIIQQTELQTGHIWLNRDIVRDHLWYSAIIRQTCWVTDEVRKCLTSVNQRSKLSNFCNYFWPDDDDNTFNFYYTFANKSEDDLKPSLNRNLISRSLHLRWLLLLASQWETKSGNHLWSKNKCGSSSRLPLLWQHVCKRCRVSSILRSCSTCSLMLFDAVWFAVYLNY